jgi:UDPglucose 6-dehydrogenase
MRSESRTPVCVIGIWHQGAVAAACLSDMGYQVTAVDRDAQRIEKLNHGEAPLFEPGLDELIASGVQAGTLRFTTQLNEGMSGARYVWLAYDTPVDDEDQSDLSEILTAVREMAPLIQSSTSISILVTCQVPVGTCNRIEAEIRQVNPACKFGLAYSPENLRLGQAIELFRRPPLLIIGSDSDETIRDIDHLLAPLQGPRVHTTLRTAEMTKHALNSYLALTVSFANEFGKLCDEVGADGVQIAEALRKEPRIGPKAMLFPGLGFSGGTLARDVRTLQRLGDETGVDTHVMDAVWQVNEEQNQSIVRNIARVCGSLRGLRVGVLGLTYKPGTSTLRRSIALEVIRDLAVQGAQVRAHDPKADRAELERLAHLQFCADSYETARDADVLVFVTPWPEFRELDFQRIKRMMARPIIIDSNNMLDAAEMRAHGLLHIGTGRGASRPAAGPAAAGSKGS